MEIYYPSYYKTFSCLAGDCPDSCCKEWTVDVDAKTAAYYRTLPGALGDRLRSVLRDEDGSTVMIIENGRCPMWQQDGLCRIQAELGHDALCQTCQEFPRLRHDYGDFVELGLELSCPEAARLILTKPMDLQMDSIPGGETPEYDPAVMDVLKKSRRQAFSLLADSRFSPAETLAILLLHGHTVQGQMDGGEETPFDPETLLASAKKYAAPGSIASIFSFFQGLEILTAQWRSMLEQPPLPVHWNTTLQALAQYLVQRYWLQAISDLDLVSRVKFIVTACLIVGSLGGDSVETAQLFSKEIENDPDNIDAILWAAYTSPALTDSNLLGILLG